MTRRVYELQPVQIRTALPSIVNPPVLPMNPTFRSRMRPCVPVAMLALAAACVDDGATPPTSIRAPGQDGLLAVLQCEVQVADAALSCVEASGSAGSASVAPGSGPSLEQRTFAGQGSLVRLANSGNATAAGVFSMNVTVQNLANLVMGSADGATPHAEGVRVFFSTLPAVSTGSGNVAVANATGTAMFTEADQPYFQYGGTDQTELGGDGILSSAETSAAKSWQFNIDPTVTSFSFAVQVRTETGPGELATVAPQVTSVSVPTLVPGQAATLTGNNFSATPGNNTVTVGGVAATVTGATATTLDIVVPCTSSGSSAVQVRQGGMTGVAIAANVQVPQRTLAVGEVVYVSSSAEVGCNEIMPSGGESRYVMSVYSASTAPGSNAAFQISGDPAGADAGIVQGDAMSQALIAPQGAPRWQLNQVTDEQRHFSLLEKNRQQYEIGRAQMARNPRMRPSTGVVHRDPVEPPVTRTFRVSNINSSQICRDFYVVAATRVYYNGKIAIYEDDATPADFKAGSNATMADYYQRIGNQFNADMEPVIRNNFGDVLRRDVETDNNGVLVALFTPRINNTFSGVAGFVVSCDQFPNDDTSPEPAVGGPYTGTGTFAASNHGEFFYAYQPTAVGTGYSTFTPDQWYRTVRSTFIHETKHVASMAARYANDAPSFEASWLEEGTARHSEELWMRNAVDNVAWKANTGYGSASNPINVYCDVRPGFPECDANSRRPASIMQRHFTSLYTHLFGTNARLLSPFGATPSDNASYWYAISWSLARYAIDRYGTSDAAFLTALTQSTTSGATNLAGRAGVPIDRLLGGWSLSLAVDDYPGLTSPSADVQMPTWNFRSIYAGLNTDFPNNYTLPYPQVPTSLTFGNFTQPAVTTLRGGGSLWYQISGNHVKPQLVRLRSSTGGTVPTDLRLAITRVQ
jgi:IPT/TIG domain